MNKDMTVPCEDGFINIRVGAIIMKNGKILMVGNDKVDYLYTVGGRIKFGETAEEAVIREVLEETGVKMEVDRLGFIHENYFYGDNKKNLGRLVYEIAYYFYMKVTDDFEPVCMSITEDNNEEFLRWIDPGDPVRYYPDFFRDELSHPSGGVKHFLKDERNGKRS